MELDLDLYRREVRVSFSKLAVALPKAKRESIREGHVPHQSNADWFNGLVLQFLKSL